MDLNRTPERLHIPFTQEDSGDIIEFEQQYALGRIQLHGIVTDVARDERHYSGFYKFIRCLLYGEPYQLRKAGRNDYGTTASYTTLRLEPLEQNGLAREVLCFGELTSRLSCGDEVVLRVRRVRNQYHFAGGENLTLGIRIRGDLFCIRPGIFLIPFLLLIATCIPMIPELRLAIRELTSTILTCAVVGFLLYITIFRDIIRFFRRR